jgi:hypothetical protein
MPNTYEAVAPDGSTYTKESSRPITYGIAHLSSNQEEATWIINSFSFGSRETAEKRMKSLKNFYKGEWAVVEAKLSSNG